jgi:hypothetical protein
MVIVKWSKLTDISKISTNFNNKKIWNILRNSISYLSNNEFPIKLLFSPLNT